MGRAKISWRIAGFRELRTQPGMLRNLQGRADRIADACGPGFKATPVGVTGGRGRGRVAVVATTKAANRRNAKEHTLMRNLDAGG